MCFYAPYFKWNEILILHILKGKFIMKCDFSCSILYGKFHKLKGKFHVNFTITLKISISNLENPFRIWNSIKKMEQFSRKIMEFSRYYVDFPFNPWKFHLNQGKLHYLPVKV